MGVVPLQFQTGVSAAGLGLTGEEVYDVAGLVEGLEKNFAEADRLRAELGALGVELMDTPQGTSWKVA